MVLIDGPAGSGKSTVANRIAIAMGGEPSPGCGTFEPETDRIAPRPIQILHGDDMLGGWDGLPTLGDVLMGDVLSPLARGDHAVFRMWDWERDARGKEIPIVATDTLIVEGVGVGQDDTRPYANLLVYVEASADVRLERGIERDGDHLRDHWIRWLDVEADHFAEHGTREAADVIVDGNSSLPD